MTFLDDFFWQEAVVVPPYVAFAIRPNPGFWEFVKVNAEDLSVEGITVPDFLKFKEMLYDEKWYVHFCGSRSSQLQQYQKPLLLLLRELRKMCSQEILPFFATSATSSMSYLPKQRQIP